MLLQHPRRALLIRHAGEIDAKLRVLILFLQPGNARHKAIALVAQIALAVALAALQSCIDGFSLYEQNWSFAHSAHILLGLSFVRHGDKASRCLDKGSLCLVMARLVKASL